MSSLFQAYQEIFKGCRKNIQQSLFRAREIAAFGLAPGGTGNRRPKNKELANPRDYARGGMVTRKIEPCIISKERSV